ncbi:MAG: ribbon-helix-helix domain-containing protein [Propionibacteriaceae bacterium]|jgi:hypothetical protein|nr:ribbon-helix-helix domain-containing protein [Propionibacteriaceae bacterium]
MVKTTLYLPEPLKHAVELEAERRGVSEAEVIRSAVWEVVTRTERPKPGPGVFAADIEPVDWNGDDWLEGFGR